jgi:predicted peptidase
LGRGLAADALRQTAATLDVQVPVKLDYLLYLPADYEEHESWPLLLFLHGAGERGDDLELVKKHGPPKLIEGGKEFPFIVVSPQCPKDRWWTSELIALSALVDEIEKKYKVDPDRIYVTGLSMGGFGTWALAGYSPRRFAAIVPICGGGESLVGRMLLRRMPVWAFHGAKDPVVPLQRSEDMVNALRASGNSEAKLTVYPEAGHDSWTETYENAELYDWLLSHKRGSVPAHTN